MSHGHSSHSLADAKTRIEGGLWASLPVVAGVVGLGGLGVSAFLGFVQGQKAQFFHSYLVAFMYVLSLALGGLFFVLLQFLTKAGWSVVVRRIAENVMGSLPVFALLFIPVVYGFSTTHHHWWHYEPGTDAILDRKLAWLNHSRFFVFAGIYFVIWIGFSLYFRRRSIEQDRTGDQAATRRMQKWAPIGMILFALSLTFASIDWLKSMDPHWFSTMWGVYYFSGSVVGIFALLIVLAMSLQKSGVVQGVINQEHYHDLGKLLFGFIVFWSYIAFSQYFLIWYANIPEETIWYQHRTHGSWKSVAQLIVVGHFFLPFFFLLPRGIKRRRGTLLLGALWALFIHYVDLYWIAMPMLHESAFTPTWLDLTTLLGVGGVFVATVAMLARRAAVLPVKDPRLPESLAFENF